MTLSAFGFQPVIRHIPDVAAFDIIVVAQQFVGHAWKWDEVTWIRRRALNDASNAARPELAVSVEEPVLEQEPIRHPYAVWQRAKNDFLARKRPLGGRGRTYSTSTKW